MSRCRYASASSGRSTSRSRSASNSRSRATTEVTGLRSSSCCITARLRGAGMAGLTRTRCSGSLAATNAATAANSWSTFSRSSRSARATSNRARAKRLAAARLVIIGLAARPSCSHGTFLRRPCLAARPCCSHGTFLRRPGLAARPCCSHGTFLRRQGPGTRSPCNQGNVLRRQWCGARGCCRPGTDLRRSGRTSLCTPGARHLRTVTGKTTKPPKRDGRKHCSVRPLSQRTNVNLYHVEPLSDQPDLSWARASRTAQRGGRSHRDGSESQALSSIRRRAASPTRPMR